MGGWPKGPLGGLPSSRLGASGSPLPGFPDVFECLRSNGTKKIPCSGRCGAAAPPAWQHWRRACRGCLRRLGGRRAALPGPHPPEGGHRHPGPPRRPPWRAGPPSPPIFSPHGLRFGKTLMNWLPHVHLKPPRPRGESRRFKRYPACRGRVLQPATFFPPSPQRLFQLGGQLPGRVLGGLYLYW